MYLINLIGLIVQMYKIPRFASRFSSMLLCSSRIASRMLASDKSRSVLAVCFASDIVVDGLELPFVTEAPETNVFETIDRLFVSVKDCGIATLGVGSIGTFTASEATGSLAFASSSSLLCGSAGFNGKAGDSSFDLMENDTDAKKNKIGIYYSIEAMAKVTPY